MRGWPTGSAAPARRLPRALGAALILASVSAPGCECGAGDGSIPTVMPSASLLRPPVDSTLPGELPEGDEQAFGFPLPRPMRVTARFPDAVHATGRASLEDVANYVRKRVAARQVETGPAKSVFRDAQVKAEPSRRVQVEVIGRGARVLMVVRDRTPRPATKGVSEAEAWRRAGLTPDGKVDPKRAE